MFFEILKAILMGVVEGITEWLPISSTGHMILVEQLIKFNASEEFMSMFRVVIQLGAILAVVVLFWNKLWPFGLRHGRVTSKPEVWQLWFKVVAATLPVLVISPLDDWFEARFYNYITVAAMLILYGVLFIVVENRRTAPHVARLEQITYKEAFLIGVWQMLAILPLRRDHRGRLAAGPFPRLCGGIHLLSGHPGHGRCLSAQSGQVRAVRRGHHRHRDCSPRGGLCGGLCGQLGRDPLPDGLRQAP